MFIDQKPKVAKISCKIVPLVLFEQDAKNPHDQVNVPVKTSTLSSESYKYGVSRFSNWGKLLRQVAYQSFSHFEAAILKLDFLSRVILNQILHFSILLKLSFH